MDDIITIICESSYWGYKRHLPTMKQTKEYLAAIKRVQLVSYYLTLTRIKTSYILIQYTRPQQYLLNGMSPMSGTPISNISLNTLDTKLIHVYKNFI